MAVWLLWKQRNAIVFEKATPSGELHRVCLERAAEFQAMLNPVKQPERSTIHISWTPPPAGWVKLNTDGSASGNPIRAGSGGVLRGPEGNWIKGFCRFLGNTNSLLAELWGVREGLIMALKQGVPYLILEMDAKSVFDMLWTSSNEHAGLMTIISECRELSQRFRGFRATHIYWEANGVADGMAKLAAKGTEVDHLDIFCCNYFDKPPNGLADVLFADMLGIQVPRLVNHDVVAMFETG